MNQEMLSKNFALREFTRSATANRFEIYNLPSREARENLTLLCEKVLQPIRDKWGKPIHVSSGYRCPTLNKLVGGVSNSDHIYGCAADITTMEDTPKENAKLFALILEMWNNGEIPLLKQCINEYGYNWLHVSYQDGRSTKRGQFISLP